MAWDEETDLPEGVSPTTGINKPLAFSNIEFVENRHCDYCGKDYPVYRRNGEETSICIHCDNKKVETEMLKQHEKAKNEKPLRIMQTFSFVPEEIQNATLTNFKVKTKMEDNALRQVYRFVKSFPDFDGSRKILLAGSVGTGKTHLAYAATKAITDKGYIALFVTVTELLESIRSTFDDKQITQAKAKEIYKTADLLVLDDIGAEYIRENNSGESWAAEVVLDLINARTDKPTIFTTNLSDSELKDHYGPVQGARIVSRMKKHCRFVELTGDDRRTMQ